MPEDPRRPDPPDEHADSGSRASRRAKLVRVLGLLGAIAALAACRILHARRRPFSGTAGATGVMFAPPPLSTQLVSGSAKVRTYGADWTGDEAVPPEQDHGFVNVDMTAWAVDFLTAAETLFAPAMAAAIAKLDPALSQALTSCRHRLAETISSTLTPVLIVPGQVPPTDSAAEQFRRALVADLGRAYALPTIVEGGGAPDMPLGRDALLPPLRVFPPVPAITAQRSLPGSPRCVAEALNWSYECTVATPRAAQDELLLSLSLNVSPGRFRPAEAADGSDPPPPDPEDLFEALARFTFEYPQIAPHLDEAPAAASGDNANPARRALERMGELIHDVARAWPSWVDPAQPRPAPPRLSPPTIPAEPPPVDSAVWDYRVDFSRRPVLGVTRALVGGSPLPPWPRIEGFETPAENGQPSADYRPSASPEDGAPLTFTFADLPATAAQCAHAAASLVRNANLVPRGMPAGTAVSEAFIYTTPRAAAANPVQPWLDSRSQRFAVGGGAPTLSAAIEEFLAPIIAQPVPAGLTVRRIRLDVGGAYRFLVVPDKDIANVTPVFLAQTEVAIGGGDSGSASVAAFRKRLVGALTDWQAMAQPSDVGASIRLSVSLYPLITGEPAPLVRLGDVEIAVPPGRPAWWS